MKRYLVRNLPKAFDHQLRREREAGQGSVGIAVIDGMTGANVGYRWAKQLPRIHKPRCYVIGSGSFTRLQFEVTR